ncbi:MAG: hypothetical protein Q8R02_23400 [Hyphomonadaceae bacterium]|nr:hypothetical protein [Hyphomonadaceae bacterium]
MTARQVESNGDWIRTMIGAFAAISVTAGGLYTVAIVPLQQTLGKLETGRDDDRKQLVSLYLSLRENDQYKIFAQAERTGLRSDLNKLEAHLLRIETEQRSRTTAVATVATLGDRLAGLTRRFEESERRSSPTITDEVKALRESLENLRARIMVPVTSSR